jgi:arsenite/tail-anchored protein-transporting ATPase
MRIILYTGKGGVGKTSVAAATACKIASSGKKVLVLSTDQAHSLGDSLNQNLTNAPLEVAENLYAMEIDAVEECERAWGSIKDYMKRLMTSKSGESIETEELLVFPGFEELASLFKIKEIYEQKAYDVLIVDCAPTGETLSLLKYPEMIGDWIDKIIPIKRKAVNIAGPAVEKLMKIPMPGNELFDDIEKLCTSLKELKELMDDKEVVSIRIVTTPEKIVVKEAKRNFSYLHLYGYNVDAIIINKVYPKEALSGYFNKWIENQEEALKDISESFVGIPIFKLELLKTELRTIERLQKVADTLYEASDPTAILFKETIFTVEKSGEDECFSISLPFFEINDMDLLQKGDELTIIIKNERRKFVLPSKLKRKEIKGAKYRDGKLQILF